MNYRKKLGIPAYQGHKSEVTVSKPASEPLTDRPFRGRRSALDPFLNQLGTVPDAEIARLAGVTAENVRTYRQRRQIAPVWQVGDSPVEVEPPAPPVVAARPRAPRAAPTSAPAPLTLVPAIAAPAPIAAPARAVEPTAPEATAAPAGTAFLVVVDTDQGPRSYALIAADIADAATAAAARVPGRHPNGTIQSIQRIAELLPL
ncbi:MAG: hypothetical protein Q8P41_08005 [Pseudomonadota bacterium]|nr:hypothetical protein [Pseudomonadota bacterium]